MFVEIKDDKVFGSLNPQAIEKYLQCQGWQLLRRIGDKASLWDSRSDEGNLCRILLPVDLKLQDFDFSMGKAVRGIARFEQRSQLQVLEDFETLAIGDVIRLRSEDPMVRAEGTLPLDQGINLVTQARDMAMAAACAVIEPTAILPSRRPAEAEHYIRETRLGQTERGSYIVKLVSPLPPEQFALEIPGMVPPVPYERRVVDQLVKSLNALHQTTVDAQKRGPFRLPPFQELIPEGVSANLCEAIATTEEKRPHRALEVSVTYSYALRPQHYAPKVIQFPLSLLPYIAKAGRGLRETNPEEAQLVGFVVTLHRVSLQGPGEITLTCLLEGKQLRVRIRLSEDNYTAAIRAHELGERVSCHGRLVREGRSRRLDRLQEFKVLPWKGRTPFEEDDEL